VLELVINNIFTKLNHYKPVLIFNKFKFKKLVIALRSVKLGVFWTQYYLL